MQAFAEEHGEKAEKLSPGNRARSTTIDPCQGGNLKGTGTIDHVHATPPSRQLGDPCGGGEKDLAMIFYRRAQ